MRRGLFLVLFWFWVVGLVRAQCPIVKVNTSDNQPEEMAITINPANPANLVAAANLRNLYYSFDGGQTWTEKQMGSRFGVWGDPSLAADSLGTIYYAHLSNPQDGHWLDRIVVQVSLDGGKSWNAGVGVGLNGSKQQDKEWLAVDLTNSPYKNTVYMAWTEFDVYGSSNPGDSTRILFAYSAARGYYWSEPRRVSDHGGNCLDGDETVEGAVPAVGPEGQVYLAWSGPLGIMFDKSLDAGHTFGKDVFVADQPGGWDFNVPGINRCNGLPITLCDVSNSPTCGTVYVVWSDQRNGTNDTDVFLARSLDGGETWSEPIRVNDDTTGTHQFFPWATIDQSTGAVYVVFYDRRNYTDTRTDVYLAVSADGGETFTNERISRSPFTPTASVFFGDYINIAAANGRVYPIWMRMDNRRLSAWVALIGPPPTGVPGRLSLPQSFTLAPCFPNPFNFSTVVRYRLPVAARVRLTVYDVSGRLVRVLGEGLRGPGERTVRWDGRNDCGQAVASGTYLVQLWAVAFGKTYRALTKTTLLR